MAIARDWEIVRAAAAIVPAALPGIVPAWSIALVPAADVLRQETSAASWEWTSHFVLMAADRQRCQVAPEEMSDPTDQEATIVPVAVGFVPAEEGIDREVATGLAAEIVPVL